MPFRAKQTDARLNATTAMTRFAPSLLLLTFLGGCNRDVADDSSPIDSRQPKKASSEFVQPGDTDYLAFWVGTWTVSEIDGREPGAGDPVRLIVARDNDSALVSVRLTWEYRGNPYLAKFAPSPTGYYGAIDPDNGELRSWIPYACGPRGWHSKVKILSPKDVLICYTEENSTYGPKIEEFETLPDRKQHLIRILKSSGQVDVSSPGCRLSDDVGSGFLIQDAPRGGLTPPDSRPPIVRLF
jgi:hypothetical protein